jgi:hypothetical protein
MKSILLVIILFSNLIYAVDTSKSFNKLSQYSSDKLAKLRSDELLSKNSIKINSYTKLISTQNYKNIILYNLFVDIYYHIFSNMQVGDIKNFIITYDLIRECNLEFNKLFFEKNGQIYMKYSLMDGQLFFEYIIDKEICTNKKDVKLLSSSKMIQSIDSSKIVDTIVSQINKKLPIQIDKYTKVISFKRENYAIIVTKELDIYSLDIEKFNISKIKNRLKSIETNSLCTNSIYKKLFSDGYYFLFNYISNIDNQIIFSYKVNSNTCNKN